MEAQKKVSETHLNEHVAVPKRSNQPLKKFNQIFGGLLKHFKKFWNTKVFLFTY